MVPQMWYILGVVNTSTNSLLFLPVKARGLSIKQSKGTYQESRRQQQAFCHVLIKETKPPKVSKLHRFMH